MAKFKVGDEVIVKNGKDTNMTLVITQSIETTCSAGTQTRYSGRLWTEDADGNNKRVCILKLASFEEIELETK